MLTKEQAFSTARALYWYCAQYHNGQWSDLYRIMCALPYKPGAWEFGVDGYDDPEALEAFAALERRDIDPQETHDAVMASIEED